VRIGRAPHERGIQDARAPNGHCGPFFDFTAFKAVYEELAKHVGQAGNVFIRFFPRRTKAGYQTTISFMEAQGVWAQRFYGRAFDRSQIEELRALVAAAETG
jgi:hypothetical protein